MNWADNGSFLRMFQKQFFRLWLMKQWAWPSAHYNYPENIIILSEKLEKFRMMALITANGYTCLEKLTTEKCKQQAKQPEKKILKIKILWKFSLQYLS